MRLLPGYSESTLRYIHVRSRYMHVRSRYMHVRSRYMHVLGISESTCSSGCVSRCFPIVHTYLYYVSIIIYYISVFLFTLFAQFFHPPSVISTSCSSCSEQLLFIRFITGRHSCHKLHMPPAHNWIHSSTEITYKVQVEVV